MIGLTKISNLIKSCNWNLSSDLFIYNDQHQQFTRRKKIKEARANLWRESDDYYYQKNQNNEVAVRERAKQSNRSCYKHKQLGQSVKHTTPPTNTKLREETWESVAPKNHFHDHHLKNLIHHFTNDICTSEVWLVLRLPHRKKTLLVVAHHLHKKEPNVMPSFNFT